MTTRRELAALEEASSGEQRDGAALGRGFDREEIHPPILAGCTACRPAAAPVQGSSPAECGSIEYGYVTARNPGCASTRSIHATTFSKSASGSFASCARLV